MYDGVQVFSATKHIERNALGTHVTRWIQDNRDTLEVVDTVITQSSDAEFHCVTITLMWRFRAGG